MYGEETDSVLVMTGSALSHRREAMCENDVDEKRQAGVLFFGRLVDNFRSYQRRVQSAVRVQPACKERQRRTTERARARNLLAEIRSDRCSLPLPPLASDIIIPLGLSPLGPRSATVGGVSICANLARAWPFESAF